jgi:hypothetical protein
VAGRARTGRCGSAGGRTEIVEGPGGELPALAEARAPSAPPSAIAARSAATSVRPLLQATRCRCSCSGRRRAGIDSWRTMPAGVLVGPKRNVPPRRADHGSARSADGCRRRSPRWAAQRDGDRRCSLAAAVAARGSVRVTGSSPRADRARAVDEATGLPWSATACRRSTARHGRLPRHALVCLRRRGLERCLVA